jgi:hypothetical protein
MVMAGFAPTPAEEMTDDMVTVPTPAPAKKVYKLKPQEGDDAEKVPASVTDASAPVITDADTTMLEATIVAVSKGRSATANTYGILVNESGHGNGCHKDDAKRIKCDCGGDYWVNTFHDTPWEEAKKHKGNRAVFTMVKNAKGFTNVESLEAVQ